MSPDTGRLGITIGTLPAGLPADGRWYLHIAHAVESSSFDLLFVGDHIAASNPNSDAITVLGAWAAVTQRVGLGTAVLLLGLRDPVIAAKQLATVDYLSGGRLTVGVGVGGGVPHEWAVMEVDQRTRGARTDEYLDALRGLWSGGESELNGSFRSFQQLTLSPRPAQDGGPPVWVGGSSSAALERARRHDGWCGFAETPEAIRSITTELRLSVRPEFRMSLVLLAAMCRDAKQEASAHHELRERFPSASPEWLDAASIIGPPDAVAERIAEYRHAGIQDMLLCPLVPPERCVEQIGLMDAYLQ